MDKVNINDSVVPIILNDLEPNSLTSLKYNNNTMSSNNQLPIFLSVSFIVGIHSCVGLFPNCGVLLLIFKRRRNRALQYLNAHLAVVSILIICQGIMYLSDESRHSESSWCSIVVYVRNCLINLLALSVLFISHERVQGLGKQRQRKDVKVFQIAMRIWGISLFAAIPSFFSANFVQHTHSDGIAHSACVKGPFLGNFIIGLIYETLRCLMFHVMLCCYLMFELYKIRARLKYFYFLQPVPSRRLRRVRRVRFIFINSIIFCLIWLPFGLIHSMYTPFRDLDKIRHFSMNYTNPDEIETLIQPVTAVLDDGKPSLNRHPCLYYVAICIVYMYIILLPVTIYCTHNNALNHIRRLICPTGRHSSGSSSDRERNAKRPGSDEISRGVGTTIAKSESPNEAQDTYDRKIKENDPSMEVPLTSPFPKQTIVTINVEFVDVHCTPCSV